MKLLSPIFYALVPAVLVSVSPPSVTAQEAAPQAPAVPAAEVSGTPAPPLPETTVQTEEEIRERLRDQHSAETNRYEASIKPYVKQRLTDKEIVEFAEAVKTYVYGQPPSFDTLKVFDRTRMDTVVLKYVGLVKDPDCHGALGNGFVAVCGQMKGEEDDDYVLTFVCRRKSEREERKAWSRGGGTTLRRPLDQVTVRDVFVKSINGVVQNEVYIDEDGMWHARPVEQPGS